MYCVCHAAGARGVLRGWHLRPDGLWSHAQCDLPSREYFKENLKKMATDLILLQGGPIHNTILDHEQAQDRKKILAMDNGAEILKHVDDYRYTPEQLTGQSGRVAAIWNYDPKPAVAPYERNGTARDRRGR